MLPVLSFLENSRNHADLNGGVKNYGKFVSREICSTQIHNRAQNQAI